MRVGFIRCNRANSPVSDHHSEARREKWDISDWFMVVNEEVGGEGLDSGEEGACRAVEVDNDLDD